VRKNTGKDFEKATFKYYSEALHKAAFVLPVFVERAIAETRQKKEDEQEKKAEAEAAKEKEKSKDQDKEKEQSNGGKPAEVTKEDGEAQKAKRKRDDEK